MLTPSYLTIPALLACPSQQHKDVMMLFCRTHRKNLHVRLGSVLTCMLGKKSRTVTVETGHSQTNPCFRKDNIPNQLVLFC